MSSEPPLPVLDPGPAALTALGGLVAERRPVGATIFDLFLAAQMRSHGIATICTYNGVDFAGLPGIRAATPEEVIRTLG